MKRKGKERDRVRILPTLFFRTVFILAIALLLPCSYLVYFLANVDVRPEHKSVERSLTQIAKVPRARRDRLSESEIEYEDLKETLFRVVEDTEISNVLDDHFITYFTAPRYCGMGHSINYVSTNTQFTDVVQRYNTWAANNDWHYEHSAKDDRLHFYHNSRKAWLYRSTLTIQPLGPAPNRQVARRINPDFATHYRLELKYVDPLCGKLD